MGMRARGERAQPQETDPRHTASESGHSHGRCPVISSLRAYKILRLPSKLIIRKQIFHGCRNMKGQFRRDASVDKMVASGTQFIQEARENKLTSLTSSFTFHPNDRELA